MSVLSIGSVPALLLMAAHAAKFGNIVTTAYAAIFREIKQKGEASRFTQTDRGKFALKQ